MATLPTTTPRCLAGFSTRAVPVTAAALPGGLAFTAFALACPCGGNQWTIVGHHYSPGGNEAALVGPVALRCAACARELPLIDTDVHGYDGEHGDSCATSGDGPRGAWACPRCGTTPAPVVAAFGYQYEDPEPGTAWAHRLHDLFDAFVLAHRCAAGGGRPVVVATFKCA
ncbi:MAG TPA: hypothetical protein VEA69_22765 [Tepidisphaeraceae bacterium]|nr:hypothetical protein [Tepidisphaeraceae bacterium]